MRADDMVERARGELAAGRRSAALRSAWDAVNQAMLQADDRPVRGALEVAESLAATGSGKERGDAEVLVRYCRAVLDGVGGGVEAPGIIDRIFSRSGRSSAKDRRRCPECAEDIHVDAKVCRHCGHRLAPPPDWGVGP